MISRRNFITAIGLSPLIYPTTTFASNSPTVDYHPILWHLDLVTLAYQMYGQSIVWPFDPYYEEQNKRESQRNSVMKQVWNWTKNPQLPQDLKKFG